MATIIVVTSGKGGVGKTTTAAAFGTGLALQGKRTVVVDFDVGLRNLDLIMGCERRVVFDLIDVINGDAKLNQALIKDKRVEGLQVLATSQTRDKDALTREGVEQVIEELKSDFDYIVCDSPAGIEHGAQTALYFADEAIVVTNPEVSSIRDSDRMVGILASVAPGGTQRGSGQIARADHPLRPRTGQARRDAEGRGRHRDARPAAARRDPRIGIGAPGVECRGAGRARPGIQGGPGLPRCRRPVPRSASRVSFRRCREEQRFGGGFFNRLWRRSA